MSWSFSLYYSHTIPGNATLTIGCLHLLFPLSGIIFPPKNTPLTSSNLDSISLPIENFPDHPIKIAKRFFPILYLLYVQIHIHTHKCVCTQTHLYIQYLCVLVFYETGKNKSYKALIHHLVHSLCTNI